MKTATIVLFTYKRIDSLRKCLSSLAACELADVSDLVVFSDAPRTEADAEKVAVVRSYLRNATGFKSIRVVEREMNMGVDYNIINGIKEMEQLCERFIVLEDDVVFAANFLLFMNQSLEKYATNNAVLTISGFGFVNNVPAGYPFDAYFTCRSWSWGWATWSDKVKLVDWDVKDYNVFEKDRSIQNSFNKAGGSDLARMLLNTMQGRIRAWDIRLFYYQFKNKMVSLYPVTSKTMNIGFSPEGHNTFGYNRYKTELDDGSSKTFRLPDDISVDKKINSLFLQKNNLTSRIKTKVFSAIGIK